MGQAVEGMAIANPDFSQLILTLLGQRSQDENVIAPIISGEEKRAGQQTPEEKSKKTDATDSASAIASLNQACLLGSASSVVPPYNAAADNAIIAAESPRIEHSQNPPALKPALDVSVPAQSVGKQSAASARASYALDPGGQPVADTDSASPSIVTAKAGTNGEIAPTESTAAIAQPAAQEKLLLSDKTSEPVATPMQVSPKQEIAPDAGPEIIGAGKPIIQSAMPFMAESESQLQPQVVDEASAPAAQPDANPEQPMQVPGRHRVASNLGPAEYTTVAPWVDESPSKQQPKTAGDVNTPVVRSEAISESEMEVPKQGRTVSDLIRNQGWIPSHELVRQAITVATGTRRQQDATAENGKTPPASVIKFSIENGTQQADVPTVQITDANPQSPSRLPGSSGPAAMIGSSSAGQSPADIKSPPKSSAPGVDPVLLAKEMQSAGDPKVLPMASATKSKETADRGVDARNTGIHPLFDSGQFVTDNGGKVPLLNAGSLPDRALVSNVVHQIVRAAKVHTFADGAGMTLRLNPPQLGTIYMNVKIEQGIMTAAIQTSTESAKQVLESGINALRQALADSGVNVDSLSVSVGADLSYNWNQHTGPRDGSAANRGYAGQQSATTVSESEADTELRNYRGGQAATGLFDYLA